MINQYKALTIVLLAAGLLPRNTLFPLGQTPARGILAADIDGRTKPTLSRWQNVRARVARRAFEHVDMYNVACTLHCVKAGRVH